MTTTVNTFKDATQVSILSLPSFNKDDIATIEKGHLRGDLIYLRSGDSLIIAKSDFDITKKHQNQNCLSLELISKDPNRYRMSLFFDNPFLAGRALNYLLKEYMPKGSFFDNSMRSISLPAYKMIFSRAKDLKKFKIIKTDSFLILNKHSCNYNIETNKKADALFINKVDAEKIISDINNLLDKTTLKSRARIKEEYPYFLVKLPMVHIQKLF
jgi:hypothetical protein